MLGRVLLGILLTVSPWVAAAQNTIKGKVTDAATGEPLIGVTILMKEEKGVGVTTDAEGQFHLPAQRTKPVSLTVQYVGYKEQEIAIYDFDKAVNVQLSEDLNDLSEVVVVGYGTQKRTQLTGSVTTVRADVFEKLSVPTLDGALSGQVAGLNVTASSGQPGADSQIRIRGGNSVNASNEPLYVVDGFIYFKDASGSGTGLGAIASNLNPLATINPNDIERIEVLKDVSATAIYGSRGANGVILITTKRGQIGQNKSNINYSYHVGLSQVSKKLDLMNATEFAQLQKEYFNNRGGYTDAEIAALGKGTDWQDAVLRQALQQSHEVSVTGGNASSRYAFSGSYTDQQGIVLNTGFQRYNFHANVEWELRPGVHFGFNTSYGRSKQDGLTTGEAQKFNSSPFSAGITNSFVYALLMPPVVSVYNADGTYNFNSPYEYAYFAIGDHSSNPVYDLKENVAQNINNYLLSNVWATYQTGHWTWKATLGLNTEKFTQHYFSGAYTSLGLAVEGIGGTGNRQTDIWQEEYTATYSRELSYGQSFDVLAGYTRQNTASEYSTISTNHFVNESLKQYNLGDGSDIYTPKTKRTESKLHSLIARVNYTLLERYNLTATYRRDYSSRFAEGNRWGEFPSLGLSWNVDKEQWFQSLRQIDYLKVRLSTGLVGNQEIPDFVFETSYDTGSYGGSSSYAKQHAANKNLRWETTSNYNVGLDLGLWQSRLNVVLDAYYKKTKDLLLVVPMGFSSGVTSQYQNVGSVTNQGIELGINATLLRRRNLQWFTTVNLAWNRNEIVDMGTTSAGVTDDIIQGDDNQQILRRGESLGSFYGLRFAGIVQSDEDVSKLPTVNGHVPQPGDLKFVDTDQNNRIDGNDRQVLGSIQPDLTFGWSTQVLWHQFDASLTLSGSLGNKVYNALGRRLETAGDSYNVLRTVKDSWTETNPANRLPQATRVRPFSYIDSRYVQDASYLKVRSLSLGYNVPIPQSAGFRLRVTASANNLLTFTPYKGYDPEVSSGTDNGVYPSSRSFTLGVNVSL